MTPAARIRPALVALALACLCAAAGGCRAAGPAPAAKENTVTRPTIAEVIRAHDDSLMAVPGVVGISESRTDDGTPCVKIMVVQLDATLRARLPVMLEGYPVVLEESGEIRAMPDTSR